MIDIEQSIRRHLDAFNAHDASAWGSHYGEEARIEDPYYPEPLKGSEAAEKDIADLFRAFPDMKVELKNLITKDHSYALECTLRGTHKGVLELPSGKVEPTNKPVEFGVSVFGGVDDDGTIVDEHRYFDVATQMVQLGLMQ